MCSRTTIIENGHQIPLFLGIGQISSLAGYPAEIIRPVIQYCRIFSLTNVIRPDIRQFSLLYQTNLTLFGQTLLIRLETIHGFD